MRHGRIVYVLGDVHGDFRNLNNFINTKIRQDKTLRSIVPYWKANGDDLRVLIMQCGDFAYYWPGQDSRGKIKNDADYLPDGRVPVYWTGGNHEDWDQLDKLGRGITEIDRGVFFCPFGSVLSLAPHIDVLFAGGAESVDKDYRLKKMAEGAPKIWWEQEGVSHADLARLEKVEKADWVISHTAPSSFNLISRLAAGVHLRERSRLMLEQILVKYNPKRWFFGHFHFHETGFDYGCEWECLDCLDGMGKAWDKIYVEWDD